MYGKLQTLLFQSSCLKFLHCLCVWYVRVSAVFSTRPVTRSPARSSARETAPAEPPRPPRMVWRREEEEGLLPVQPEMTVTALMGPTCYKLSTSRLGCQPLLESQVHQMIRDTVLEATWISSCQMTSHCARVWGGWETQCSSIQLSLFPTSRWCLPVLQ